MDDGGSNNGIDTATRSFMITIMDLPEISKVTLPNGDLSSNVTVTYTVTTQPGGPTAADIEVEVSESATAEFVRATQAGSDSEDGVVAVTASATGAAHKFLWNSIRDFPGLASSDARIRIRASIDGARGTPITLTGLKIANNFQLGSPTTVDIGAVPNFVARADLNLDGTIDLVVTADNNSVSVFLQKPSNLGSFQSPQTFTAGMANLVSVDTGDFNKDGKADLVVGDDSGMLIVLLQGASSFTFAAGSTLNLSGSLASISATDMDGDGDLDVVAANSASLSVILQDPANPNSFLTATAIAVSGPIGVTISEVNLDGKVDIITANGTGNNVSVILQDGSNPGQSVAPTNFSVGSNPISVAVADINGDGKPDIATANNGVFGSDDGSVSVLFQDAASPGTFKDSLSFRAGSRPAAVALADLNGDGKPDIVSSNIGDEKLTIILAR
jgi:hypothetical protein